MQRSRLKNIINMSKGSSTKPVEEPFDLFKKSLPIGVPEGYRLEAAWTAYGKPKDYKHALWEGLILLIDDTTYKWPSIGYNTETEEYEYLNEGKENDTVAKDIRVWDNDVIPFVQELKQGGFIRQFNEEKNCWTYKKGTLEAFKLGGKYSKKEKNDLTYAEFIATLPPNLLKGNDGESGYRMRYAFDNSPDVWTFDDAKDKFIFWNEGDLSWHGSSIFEPTGEFLKPSNHPTLWMEEAAYMSSKPKLIEGKEDNGNPENYVVVPMTGEEKEAMDNFRSRFNLVKTDENGNPLKYWKYVPKLSTQVFKQGGQMTTIPSGSLHAHKNHMQLASEGEITSKGIPVVTTDGKELTAEIERNEIVFRKEATDTIEEAYKKYYNEETSQSEKDELAIKIGKFLVKEIMTKTDDKTGLILEVADKL